MYKFLDICDVHSIALLQAALHPGVKEIFHSLHTEFQQYHKYKGKIWPLKCPQVRKCCQVSCGKIKWTDVKFTNKFRFVLFIQKLIYSVIRVALYYAQLTYWMTAFLSAISLRKFLNTQIQLQQRYVPLTDHEQLQKISLWWGGGHSAGRK